MPLVLRPHRLQVRSLDVPTTDLGVAKVGSHVPETTQVLGKAEPLGADAAFRAYGIELSEPYRVMVNLEDANAFQVGALVRVVELAEWLKVAAPPSRHGATALTSHAVVLCQKADPPGGTHA